MKVITMDDNVEKLTSVKVELTVQEENDLRFDACGRIKIESEVDLGITEIEGGDYDDFYPSSLTNEDSLNISENSQVISDEGYNISKEDVEVLVKRKKTVGNVLHKCDECNYATFQPYHLKSHKQSHSDYRPFLCSFCSYRGKRPYALEEHMRIHTNEKPYPCSFCDYRGRKRSALTDHIKSHHTPEAQPERPYKCIFCDHRSKRSSHLIAHMKKHNDTRPYKCEYCSYAAKRPGHLKLHVDLIHFKFYSNNKINQEVSTFSAHSRRKYKYDKYICYVCHFKTDKRKAIKKHLDVNHKIIECTT